MSRQRFIWLAIAAVVVLGAALFLSGRRNSSETTPGAALLPSLKPVASSIKELTIRRGSATPTVTVHDQGGTWTVAQRGDYPADVSKVRKLVDALADAKIIEEKTSDPGKFPVIGVEDPAAANAAGAEIVLTAKDGKHGVIVGKSAGEGNFARRSGEKVSFIVSPSITYEADPKYWIDPKLVDIQTGSIQSVEVKPAAGSGAYALRRAPAAAASGGAPASAAGTKGSSSGGAGAASSGAALTGDFALEGLPTGRKAAEPATLAPSPSLLAGLTAEDVVQASNVDFTKPSVATITLADGATLTVTGASSGDKHWIELKSSKDTGLDARAAGRAFEIPSYRYDAIFRPLDQLLVPKETPPSKGAKPAGKPKSSSTP